MDFTPSTQPSNSVLGSQATDCENSQALPNSRKTWAHSDYVLLISSWLNTSKDPIVGNEQRSDAFWKRIVVYYSANRDACDKREATHCKNRWQKINDQVCKFSGAYEAATRERTSGQNENDVLNRAHNIFFTNHQKKFTLQHAWQHLRHDQKWCAVSTAKKEVSSKKRRCEDGSHSASSKATEVDSSLDDDGTTRPAGVKAAKKGKNKVTEVELADFHKMWAVKKQDLEVKERLSKMKVLDSLIANPSPLADYEEDLKKKLIQELMYN
ncbi:hypothetical protein Bca101_082954 [Brassica carinata]